MEKDKKVILAKIAMLVNQNKIDEADELAKKHKIPFDKETSPLLMRYAVGDELIFTDWRWVDPTLDCYAFPENFDTKGALGVAWDLEEDEEFRALNIVEGNWSTSHIGC